MLPVIGQQIDICPSTSGLKSWRAMAYAPQTSALYIPITLSCELATFGPTEQVLGFIGRTDYHNIAWDHTIAPGEGRVPASGKDGIWLEIGKSFEIMDGLTFDVAALFSPSVRVDPSTTPSSIILAPGYGDQSRAALTFKLTKTLKINE